jgi:hypothetical protein
VGQDINVLDQFLCQWRECFDSYCSTGNKAREQIAGIDLINLVTFLQAWPEVNLEKLAVFLYNEGGPCLY